ncbi:class I SAM-dependent methyltransferase [Imperialibacter roseus]|uniref:Class I SAM-dependent methyltransferase n=1 Tax=Imperialibacter roseus TaxID=1324217 RepID=A0ABZ0IPL9_9BACT|nr:class I SAM-dependent methyltransferase [Imperialibacter roseus]WOK05935.1 class I SAM-dependent methyltransferase [Imperialibacter roseus]
MANGFNLLAPVYDPLARLVFGKCIDRSQCDFFGRAVSVKSTLVAGGGTGRFFEEYFKQHPDSQLAFIEKSAGMIAKARSRTMPGMNIGFVRSDFLTYSETDPYDLVLLPFFLDMFSDESVEGIVKSVSQVSKPNTLLIVTDFVKQEKRGWKSLLIRGMYLFFRLTCDIEAHRLPNWQEAFARAGWNIKESATYCRGMIGTHLLARS